MPTELGGVKTNGEAGNIRVYIMTIQKGQSCKLLSQGSWKFMYFAKKIKQETSGPGKSAAGVMYPSLRIHLKR